MDILIIIIAIVLIVVIMIKHNKKVQAVAQQQMDDFIAHVKVYTQMLELGRQERLARLETERLEVERKQEELIETTKTLVHDNYVIIKDTFLNPEHYFAHSEMEQFLEESKECIQTLEELKSQNLFERLGEEATFLYDAVRNIAQVRTVHNQAFVNNELETKKEFFDTVLDYPLDDQQRESVVKLEDNCLVISSAGSGKTSTMMGKLLYLTHERQVPPGRILTITYTHKAAEELTQRLMGTGLSCMTFHKLAMNIIAKVEEQKPSIADMGLFAQVFYAQLQDEDFRVSILNYLTDYQSLMKLEHDYATSIDYYKDRRKYGIMALYTDKDGKLIATKSEEERRICSFLTELGVDFKYEQPYYIETYTEDYRQYKPDFTIYYKNEEGLDRTLYLEHFAINRSGNVPQWFGSGRPDGWYAANTRYQEGIQWKIDLHKESGTNLVYTTSADFHNNTIRKRLRELLVEAGVPVKEVPKTDLLEKIFSRSKSAENALMQMAQSFISLVKANGKTIEDIRQMALSRNSARDVFVIDNIMTPLWNSYHKELSERGEVDFTDVIVKATRYCNEGKWKQKYEYILIDEFQDISIDRYHFLLSLRTDLPKTKLYCVGDDWQSIYRFSGSDMSLFADFSKYFGYTEECKIETTYRFGNPLVEESSKFAQNNPLQKKKNVHPRMQNPPETKISYMGYANNEELQSLIERMIARVPEDKTAYIISRYSYDVKVLVSPSIKMVYDQNTDSVILDIANRKVKFMTIHGSKGLEADYVFVLNCNSGLYGFPSLVSDDPLLDYVLSNPEHYEYAEERRVFYVGITRAKVHTVVLYNTDTPSPFVSEMDNKISLNPNPCPWCGVGHRVLKYEGWTKQKTPYRVWGCDNREANCQYFEREFYNGNYMNLTGKKIGFRK